MFKNLNLVVKFSFNCFYCFAMVCAQVLLLIVCKSLTVAFVYSLVQVTTSNVTNSLNVDHTGTTSTK